MKRMIAFFAVLCVLAGSCAREEGLRTGDLVFVGIPADYSLDESSMDSAIAGATGGKEGLNLIHVAIAEVSDGRTWIIDATIRHGVDRHPLDTFLTDFTLKDGSMPVFKVMRLKDASVARSAVERAKQFIGMPYDVAFQPDNGALYCTELVQESYLSRKGSRIFPSAPMNFKNAEGEFPVYWTQLFERIGQSIPQGVPGTNPQEMSRDPHLDPVDVTLPCAPCSAITCADAKPGEANQWIAFRKDITLGEVPGEALASIAVDSKYWLWINGREVVFEGALKRGPTPDAAYFDVVDLAPYLRKGENRIALLLWYFGKSGFSHSDSGQAQLLFDCPVLDLRSDGTWLCRVHPAYGTADCPAPNYRLSESSLSFDARKDLPDWQTGSLEGFAPAVTVGSTLGTLQSRPIPQWKDFGIKKIAFETRKGETCDTVLARLPYNMQMTPVLKVSDPEGGHHILIETDHAKVGEECLRAEYVTAPGTREYESLGWLNGMRLILTVEHGATVVGLKYRETGYDTFPEGRFLCDDPFFNRFWEKGLRTIYVNARDTFFDCPERERAQWWGDIVVILNECFYTYSPSLHLLVRKGFHELCGWQAPDGSLHAPIPGKYKAELPCQMLAAVGKYGLWTYYLNTGDRETAASAYPAVKKYLALYPTDGDGLTEYRKAGWNWGDWGKNKDMRLLQTTWFCLALEGAANTAEMLGFQEDAKGYRERLDSMRDAVNRVAWTGAGYRHPDYQGKTDDRVQALAVLSGIAGPDKYDALFDVFKKEEHASPYMEKYVMEALFCMGHGDYALERTRKRFDYIVNHPDFDTLFEGWDVGKNGNWAKGSVNHAWSGGTLAVLPTRMFGIRPLEAGWKRFCVEPDPSIFDRCSLSFPTVSGTVGTDFRRSGDRIAWTIRVPEGTEAEVRIPWRCSKTVLDGRAVPDGSFTLGKGTHRIRLRLEGE
ncbi:MAG: glycoside hydrolase [Bacteroidales bacterium]|nr:glycoside hydrolase [Bacteroidales bacterium]